VAQDLGGKETLQIIAPMALIIFQFVIPVRICSKDCLPVGIDS
jgi:hypothetical protein